MTIIEKTLQRINGESDFEWKLRLIRLKNNREIDYDWAEIVEALGIDCHPDQFRKVARGIIEYDNYINGNTGVANRILCLSDFHFPYNLPKEILSDYVGRVDTLVLNGDLLDQQSISKFSKNFRISPMEEMIGCRQYLIDLIEYICPHKVIINKGNHEERFGNYLAKNIDCELKELMPQTALDYIVDDGFNHYDKRAGIKQHYSPIKEMFDNIEIEYTGNWWCVVGKAVIAHPLTYSASMLKTSEKAVNYFYRQNIDFDTCVLGHTHKLGSYIQGNVHMFEQGCLCRTEEMTYADGYLSYPQQKGFLYLCQDGNGKIIFDKTKLIAL